MNEKTEKFKGLLDGEYADARKRKMHLIFRYRLRALIVADAVKRYLGTLNGLRILDFGSAEGLTSAGIAEIDAGRTLPRGRVFIEFIGAHARVAYRH